MEVTNGSQEMGKRQSSDSHTTFDDREVKEMMHQGKRQKRDAMKPKFPKKTRFNVQGEIFEVANTTLDLCRETVIGRMADEMWSKTASGEESKEIFIDRDHRRFRYVLDYIRDRQVNLPMTESREAFQKELKYYGFDEIKEDAIAIGTVAEAGRIIGAVASNVHHELSDIDESIRGWEKQIQEATMRKNALKFANALFLRSQDDYLGKEGNFTLKVAEAGDLCSLRELADNNHGNYASEILAEHLKRYGLELVSLLFNNTSKYSSESCDIILARKA